jgi:hypothetical protein
MPIGIMNMDMFSKYKRKDFPQRFVPITSTEQICYSFWYLYNWSFRLQDALNHQQYITYWSCILKITFIMILGVINDDDDLETYVFIDVDTDIDIFVNCSWVDTRWQYTFTNKQYIEHHN